MNKTEISLQFLKTVKTIYLKIWAFFTQEKYNQSKAMNFKQHE